MLRLAEPDVQEGVSKTIRSLLEGAFEQQHKLLTQVIKRVVVSTSTIRIQLNTTKLELLLFDTSMTDPTSSDYQLHVPIKLQRRGVERKITFLDPTTHPNNAPGKNPDPALCRTIAKAHCWMQLLITGEANTVREIAQIEGIAENEISRRIQLAFLAPEIVEAIIQGQQPNTLTAQSLIRLKRLPGDWAEQRALLCFG